MPRPGDDALFTPRSPRVVAARRLTDRSVRTETGRFLVEGPQGVREALAAGAVTELFCTPAAAVRYPDLAAGATLVTEQAAKGLSETVSPQGIVAVCTQQHVDLADAVTGDLLVLLADSNEPGNAGTVLRTADAAGATAVIFGDGSVDPYNGKCVRATAGSLFHLAVVRTASVVTAIQTAQAAGILVLAAAGGGELDLNQQADDGVLAAPTLWVFGNEARGLRAEVADACDGRVAIPIYGRADSLNLAAAAAVCLYASARAQRRYTTDGH